MTYTEARPAGQDAFNLAPAGATGMTNTNCAMDYVTIGANRHCGGVLAAAIAGTPMNNQVVGTSIPDNGRGFNVFTTVNPANRIANSAFELRYIQSSVAC